VTESEPLSFADLKPTKTTISAQPPNPEPGPGQGTLPGEQNRIVPSIPRPALRGLDAPPDSIPRIPVVHQQPQPTTSAQTGQSIDPLAVKSGLSNISPIYPQTGYSSTMAPGFGQASPSGTGLPDQPNPNAVSNNPTDNSRLGADRFGLLGDVSRGFGATTPQLPTPAQPLPSPSQVADTSLGQIGKPPRVARRS
jgi:hypothetical protein